MTPNQENVVAAIAPALDESGKIGSVVAKVLNVAAGLAGVMVRVVVVDDGSVDDTAQEATRAGATVVGHPRNRGVGAAIRSGINWARENGCDIVLVLAGDDQHDPGDIPRVLAPLLEKRCDFVQGSRWLSGGRVVNATLTRSLGTRLYSAIFSLFTGGHCTDATNGLRAFPVKLLDDERFNLEQDCLDRYELEPYLLYKAFCLGYVVVEVPVTVSYHVDKRSWTKMRPIVDWWRIFRPILFLRLGIWR